MPRSTALDRAPGLQGMNLVSTFSWSRNLKMKSPAGSSPTAVKSADRRPGLLAPTAMFVGQPPTKPAKLVI